VERVLIVDDEADMLENCRRILAREGYECLSTTSAKQALRLLETERPSVLLTDLKMPEMDGLELLHRARAIDPNCPVVVITAFATIESAVVAVKGGAFDYLAKPFSIDQLKLVVSRALNQHRLAMENQHLREQLRGTYGFENIVGRSPALQQVLELVRKAARSEANILILGESGTGKELIARAVHANSPRATQAFVAVDCASLPENLLESELFGYDKGAFTGAAGPKMGLIEMAHRGTLFLDEIGELSLNLQGKLLRALQEREIRRVGGVRSIEVDVRVVSATNRNLQMLCSKGRFRQELFYRLNVVDIALPPLRERAGDVALLAHAFLRKHGQTSERKIRGFEPGVLEALESYSWPGNVRELQNVVERACALADNEVITLADLPRHIRDREATTNSLPSLGAGALTLKEAKARWMSELESAYILEILRSKGGNISQAARAAGVDRKTVRRLLAKHHLR
jgi:DNA-binding NtrC family response regulator